ncbi:hypothetical protein [Micromonospora inyonensis]|uniref:hypothetical protein n=1 Tax=Micromonospora inyonensis TaxID=47866 RepID=UPI000B87C224|nr:hypothetical protein [Micromonospora inyonensis]
MARGPDPRPRLLARPDRAVFSASTHRVIRQGDFTSRADLIDRIATRVINKNTTAKPYRWTYDGTPLEAA